MLAPPMSTLTQWAMRVWEEGDDYTCLLVAINHFVCSPFTARFFRQNGSHLAGELNLGCGLVGFECRRR